MSHWMKVTEVECEGRVVRTELRFPKDSDRNRRNHRAQLHLLAAAAEAAAPYGEDWKIDISQPPTADVVAIHLTHGTEREAAEAHEILHELTDRVGASKPSFPLPGAVRGHPSPFEGFDLKLDLTTRTEPMLRITPPAHLTSRQLRITLHLMAAAVELATQHTEGWALRIDHRSPGPSILQLVLADGSAEESRRASDALEYVVRRCQGAAMSSYERVAAFWISLVWPAISHDTWTAVVAHHLWT